MSSGTCNTVVDDEKCVRHRGHPGDHFGEAAVLPAKAPATVGPPETSIPDSVRTRVELHRAQTQYDLTVLKNRLDCLPTVTNVGKELRRRRDQLTAELEAWTYLAGVAKRVD